MERMNLTDEHSAYSENVQRQIALGAGSSPHENVGVISGYSPAEGTIPNISLHENAFTVSAEQMYQLAQYHTHLAGMYAGSLGWMTQQHLGLPFAPHPTFMFPFRGYHSVGQQNAHQPADGEESTNQPLDLSTKKVQENSLKVQRHPVVPLQNEPMATEKSKGYDKTSAISDGEVLILQSECMETKQNELPPTDGETPIVQLHKVKSEPKDAVPSVVPDKEAPIVQLGTVKSEPVDAEPSVVPDKETPIVQADTVSIMKAGLVKKHPVNNEGLFSASKGNTKSVTNMTFNRKRSFVDVDNADNSNNTLPIKSKPKPSDPSSEPPVKRRRNNYTASETALFEKIFSKCQYLKIVEVEHLSRLIGRHYNQIKYWFRRNRRDSKKLCSTTPPDMEFFQDTVIRPEFLACLEDDTNNTFFANEFTTSVENNQESQLLIKSLPSLDGAVEGELSVVPNCTQQQIPKAIEDNGKAQHSIVHGPLQNASDDESNIAGQPSADQQKIPEETAELNGDQHTLPNEAQSNQYIKMMAYLVDVCDDEPTCQYPAQQQLEEKIDANIGTTDRVKESTSCEQPCPHYVPMPNQDHTETISSTLLTTAEPLITHMPSNQQQESNLAGLVPSGVLSSQVASEPNDTDDLEQPAEPQTKKQRLQYESVNHGFNSNKGPWRPWTTPVCNLHCLPREPEPSQISPETEHADASQQPKPFQISPETEYTGSSHDEPEPSQISPETEDDDDAEQPSEQGARKQRVNNTPAQKYVLQKVFANFQYLRKSEIESLAERIGKSDSQIDYWFSNRRRFVFKGQNVFLPGEVSIYNGPIRPEFLACLDEAVAIANRSSFGTLSAKNESKKGTPKHSNNSHHKFDDAQKTFLKILFNKFHYLRHVETKALAERFGKPEEKVREWFYNRRWYDSTYKGLIIEPRPQNDWHKKAMRPEFLSLLNNILQTRN